MVAVTVPVSQVPPEDCSAPVMATEPRAVAAEARPARKSRTTSSRIMVRDMEGMAFSRSNTWVSSS